MFTHKVFVLVVLFVLIAFVSISSAFAEGVWTTYPPVRNEFNIDLFAIAADVDANNIKWFGTKGCVYSFDGHGGSVFYKENGLAGNDVRAVAVDLENIKWFGTFGRGVSRYDDTNREIPAIWKTYTTTDGLANNNVMSIAVDHNNVKWFGTLNGVSSFDGVTWKTYTIADGLAYNDVLSIAVDHNNVKWCGTVAGVSSFDGVSWKKYTIGESLTNCVLSIAVDHDNVKWFGTMGCAFSFDGATWKTYTTADVLVDDYIVSVAVDADNVKWVGTGGKGVQSFDGVTWKTYIIKDGLAGNCIGPIVVDKNNVKWILTDGGVCSFDDEAETSVKESEETPQSINIRGNFPNPFNPSTTIEFSVGSDNPVVLDIYSIAGQKVRTLVDGQRYGAGVHSVIWNGKDETGMAVSAGIYFCQITAGNLTSVHKMTLVR